MSPLRPPHPCNTPGCGMLVRQPHCPKHTRRKERSRGTTAERGYGARHKRWRKMVLKRDPLCVYCLEERRYRESTVADHITPLSLGGEPFDMANGMGLCEWCHNGRKQVEDRAARAAQ